MMILDMLYSIIGGILFPVRDKIPGRLACRDNKL